MGDRHVQCDANKQILYIDANNLYGWAMSQYLPTGELEKLQLPENYSQDQLVEDLLQIPDDNEYGFFIECDLEYPVEFKEKTKNFPFCPYQTKADPNLFSGYMNNVNQPNYKPTPQLLCDVTNKSKYMMYEFYYNKIQPYWKQSIQLHYMDTDSFILSFDTNNQELINFLQENKDEFDFSELDKSHELYDPINKKVIGKMKIETSLVLLLDSFIALGSKSYSFSYNSPNGIIEKAKQKGIQKASKCEEYQNSLFNSETSSSTNISIRSNLHNLTFEKQPKLCLNSFDDKRLYINPKQSLPWDKHTQKGDCPCIYCLKLIGLYYKELTINDEGSKKTDAKPLRDEDTYFNVWYWKQALTHQQLVKLISDRAHVL